MPFAVANDRAHMAIARWIDHAGRLFAVPITQPQVRCDLRGRTAGLTIYPRKHDHHEPTIIRLNAELLERHPREMLEQTIPHEVAHVVANHLYGPRIRPHGPEWRSIMQAFGVTPDVRHNMHAEPTRRLRRHHYLCGCPDGVELTAIRHNRAQRGTVYRCRRCGETLRPAVVGE